MTEAEKPTDPAQNREIEEPFKIRACDVTGETLVSDVPKEYYTNYKKDMQEKQNEAKAIEQGLEELAINPNIA